MTRDLRSLLRRSLDHWLATPMLVLFASLAGYTFFFTENGYLAYKEALQEKANLEKRIQQLTTQKQELEKKLGVLKDDEAALKNLSREFLLFSEKVTILKFKEETADKTTQEEQRLDIRFLGSLYLMAASLLIALITWWYYRQEIRRRENFKQEESSL